MTTDGWMVMALSVGGTTSLFVWCIVKVLATPQASEHLAAPVEADPGDREA